MSTDTSHVLAAIDHALDDYETSADAMRWTPDADDIAPPVAPPLPTLAHLGQAVVRVTVDTSQYVAAMQQMVEAVERMRPGVERAAADFGRALDRVRPWRPEAVRVWLNEWQSAQPERSGPMPLPIDGHAYHRRQRARRRR